MRVELSEWLGEPIQDAEEETFMLFSQDIPSSNLGFVDEKANVVELEITGRSLSLRQSPGLLQSQRSGGTTGAVQWRVTPLIAEWLSSQSCLLKDAGLLGLSSTVVELGCGITGLVGIILAPQVRQYFLTDQQYVLKTLRDNVKANESSRTNATIGKHQRTTKTTPDPSPSNIMVMALDWESDDASSLTNYLEPEQSINLVIACDCIYNEHLIKPLVEAMKDICGLTAEDAPATVLIAQQLRSDTIMEAFLRTLTESFDVWRVSDLYSGRALGSNSGFVLHLAQLKRGA